MMKKLYFVAILLLLTVGLASAQSGSINGSFHPTKEIFSVYPNPTRNNFYVETQSANPEKSCIISVLNIIGQPIYTAKITGDESGYIKHQILLSSDTPKGIYFVKIDDEVNDYKIVRLKIE